MSNAKNPFEKEESNSVNKDSKQEEEPLHVHNPLNPGDDKQITQEDIENEQKYKEALTERD